MCENNCCCRGCRYHWSGAMQSGGACLRNNPYNLKPGETRNLGGGHIVSRGEKTWSDRLETKLKYLEDIIIGHDQEGNPIEGNKIVIEVLGQVFSESFKVTETDRRKTKVKKVEDIIRLEAELFGRAFMQIGRNISWQAVYGTTGESVGPGGRKIKRF